MDHRKTERLIERHLLASVASVVTANTPNRHLSPASESLAIQHFQRNRIHGLSDKKFFARLGTPAGQVHKGAVFERADRMGFWVGLKDWAASISQSQAFHFQT